MSNHQVPAKRPFAPRTIRRFAPLIILAWLGILFALSVTIPPLQQVAKSHSVSLDPVDAPSYKAIKRIGAIFAQPENSSVAMVVLEGQQPLADEARDYYRRLIQQFKDDPKHVLHVQDFWGDDLTKGAAQSADGKAVYVQLALAGNSGESRAAESLNTVHNIVDHTPPPPGVKTYITGPAAVAADITNTGNRSQPLIMAVTASVLLIVLLLIYRSITTVILLLVVVGIQLQMAEGIVAFLGYHGLIGLTTVAINLVTSLVIAAGTDYGIFFIGRYQEARQAGEDREAAFYTSYGGVAKVVLASGSTIAGAIFCLHFTRLPYFQANGIPCAVAIMVAVVVALTLLPAVLAVGTRFGLFDPKRRVKAYGWRRVGTAIVRWPGPIFVASLTLALVGLLTLPIYNPSYNEQDYLPDNIAASQGISAAKRHFPQSTMMSPEVLMIEADHDMRNSADFLVLNKLSKAILAVPGVSKVQAVTRPEGTPIPHTTIPYLLSMQQAGQQQYMIFQQKSMDSMLEQVGKIDQSLAIMKNMYALMQQLVATMNSMVDNTHSMQDITNDLRNNIANFEDMWRPIRNYLYWEPHCENIPMCFSFRSVFDTLDGVDGVTDQLGELVKNLDQMKALLPQLVAQFPEMISIMESMRSMMMTMHSTSSGVFGQMGDNNGDSTAMAKAFDSAHNDDTFYITPEAFENADFKRVMDIFMSSDGKATRMLISQKGDPTSAEGLSRIDAIKAAAEEALKGTPLEESPVYLAGTATMTDDLVKGSRYDLAIAVIAAICLILIVMLMVTRSLIAALVIVGTVLVSLGASFGLAVFVWQVLIGTQIHWAVLVMALIILLAVGSDYNLLFVARMKEELHAGLNTGLIRAMGGTGKVVTSAGLVFAFTMGSMAVSDLVTLGQVGTTIAIGLMFDTLVVRSFMLPSVAALLGRWFWWPQLVRPRPASTMLRPTGPRPLVRALMLNQER
ncbi:RND family transporter [Mycolicibacterium sphagni]|uniref:RND family transporter n=1 Tax=Mycolicibacterium sphagni TaxID=1786 RepID=A0ABX2JYG2_9MYCO|nr:RND family transporter [Mycolicibacterium sphagni]NTY62711.1 RND family transporter [Mycolicibacterium sphagni]